MRQRLAWGPFAALIFAVAFLLPFSAHAERIQDLASVQGVRANQLIGYGLVVGLDGTGDQTTQTPFTTQTIENMLKRLGIVPPSNQQNMQLKNVAAVMVTADLPPFARPGETIPVTVSSLGNAKSLRGGTLLMTMLQGVDGKTYAIAQGSVIVGGYGASTAGATTRVNSLAAGRIPNGAIVERSVANNFDSAAALNLILKQPNFSTARNVVQAINAVWGSGTAVAENAGVVRLHMPSSSDSRVDFLANVQNLNVTPGTTQAKVVIDPRSGTVVLGSNVRIGPCAVAHGDLSVTISNTPVVSQPLPLSQGHTVVGQQGQVAAKEAKAHVLLFRPGATLGSVVRALNAVGATPSDLVAILQAMKGAGAIQGQLVVQ